MRYHDITKDDMKNGDGLRVVLWLSGCDHACRGCQNPLTWDPDDGLLFDDKARDELFEILSRDYISGITLSGGDPLYPGNRDGVLSLLKEVRERFPDKTIWVYTGYLYEDISGLELLGYMDVLVDGKYVESLRDNLYPWAGSTNQRVIDVKATMENGSVVLHQDMDRDALSDLLMNYKGAIHESSCKI